MRTILASVLALLIVLGPFTTTADYSDRTRISLKELGVLQLAAHDLFRVDRDLEENLENDMLDLSTVFDHGDDLIPVGGEIRNSENVAVFSVATGYANEYLEMVERGTTKEDARARIVRHYQSDIMNAARNMTGGRLPEPMTGEMTVTDDLAYRVIHDLLPGSVMVDGILTPILSPSLFRRTITDAELWAQGATMDGVVDEVFRNITFFTPEGLIVVDLIERDHSFGEQFHTDFSFQHFLDESADGRLDPDEDSTRLIRELIAKGMGNYYMYMAHIEEFGVPPVDESATSTGTTTATSTENTGGNTNESGADGDNGADGADGNNGTDGADGMSGQSGSDGSNGQTGTDGTDTTTPNTEAPVVVQSVVVTTPEDSRTAARDSRLTRSTR